MLRIRDSPVFPACLVLIVGLGLPGCSTPTERVAAATTESSPGMQQDTPGQLMQRLAAAMASEDVAALDELYNWEGVEERQAAALRNSLGPRFFGCKGTPEEILPPGETPKEFVRSGVRYHTNLPVEGRIRIACDPDSGSSVTGFTVPFGNKDGTYLFVNVVQEPTGSLGPDDESINVLVVGPSPGRIRFEVACAYVASGALKQLRFDGDGNASKAFWGTAVRSCQVRKLSGAGEVQLIISVGGKRVFESAKTDLSEPLVYPAPTG